MEKISLEDVEAAMMVLCDYCNQYDKCKDGCPFFDTEDIEVYHDECCWCLLRKYSINEWDKILEQIKKK